MKKEKTTKSIDLERGLSEKQIQREFAKIREIGGTNITIEAGDDGGGGFYPVLEYSIEETDKEFNRRINKQKEAELKEEYRKETNRRADEIDSQIKKYEEKIKLLRKERGDLCCRRSKRERESDAKITKI